MDRFDVPVVDIASYVAGGSARDRAHVAASMDRACRDVGFIQVVNLGDLTARLTNDVWMSTLHRVKPPIVDGTIRRGRSAAYFHDGNIDAVIATRPAFLDAAAGLAYEPITVRDHIRAKLARSRQGKINSAAVREAARVLATRSPA